MKRKKKAEAWAYVYLGIFGDEERTPDDTENT